MFLINFQSAIFVKIMIVQNKGFAVYLHVCGIGAQTLHSLASKLTVAGDVTSA